MIMQGVARTGGKKRVILWQSLFFIFILLMAAYVLFKSPVFNIGKIIVQGNNLLTAGEIVRVSGIVTGMNIFQADLKTAAGRIRSLPVIKEVKVDRRFPGTVLIEVTERVPVALVVTGGRFVELDAEGYYLREGSAGATGLPVITGMRVQAAGPGRPVKGAGIDTALRVVRELPGALRSVLSEVHVGGDGRVTLYTLEGIECRLGLPGDVYQKGNYFLQVLKELKEKGKNIEYVDFSILSSPVVKYRN
jgi:cell division protein FtsQ